MAKSESTKIEFGYFHDYESEQFAFYRIPKVLFTDEYFRNLSSDAKVLYGLMLDRMALSIRHQWFDEEGKKKRGKVQHIRGSPKKRKISGKAVFSSESIPGKMLADVKNLITDKASELKRADQKKLFLANFPYLMFAYFFNKIAWLYRVNTGATSWDKFMNTITYFELAFQNLWPSLNHIDLLCGIAGGVVVKLIIIYRTKNARKYRLGVEYGSARWGTEKDIRPYADPEFENNIILTETESLTMSSRPKNPKYARNKNILVIGGSGSGKTRFFVKPNIMQMHSSYVITDPKGTVLLEVGSMLAKGSPMTDENGKIVRDKEGKVIYEPYKIKVLNTINFKKSMHYNPFVYIRSEKDILKLVTTIIANTKGEGQQSGEDFWVSATRSQTVKSLRTSNGFPLFGELVV